MNDEEARALEHLAEELVVAVDLRDPALIADCLSRTPGGTLAVLLAELLSNARDALRGTKGIHPAGMTRESAWQIACESIEKEAA